MSEIWENLEKVAEIIKEILKKFEEKFYEILRIISKNFE